MNDERHNEIDEFKKIESIFLQVCDLNGSDRDQRIQSLADGDQRVIDGVNALLGADQRPSHLLEPTMLSLDVAINQEVPESIGDFQIIRVLGEGGMGIVYEAVQHAPSRRVALKVIRERSLHSKIRKRFEAEANILARLNHRGIATIYESGVAPSESGSIPYVSMELIEGDPITQYAQSNALSVDERTQLMRQVCDAVAHAHEVGIIHRDLKPSNILVDQSGRIKVLDFGIAFDMEINQRTQMTQTGQLLGTLQYMAPEQVDQRKHEASAQTDVYALGLLCYELLVGHNPLSKHDSSMYDLVRAIREDEIDLIGTHDRALKGDLETIISKALAREPVRRYDNAGALRDDLDRYLTHKPIEARKPSTWYQLSKFSQRNPVLVGSIATVFIILFVAIVLISNALRIANQQRQVAQHDQRIKTLVNEFLTDDLFATADPSQDGDPNITLINAMLNASIGIGERFADAPIVEAELRYTMGSQLRSLNQYGAARIHLERSAQLSEQLALDPVTIVMRRNELTKLYSDLDLLDEALAYVIETESMIESFDRSAKRISPQIQIDMLLSHGGILFHMDRTPDAAPLFERAVAMGREQLPDDELTYAAIADLAIVLTRLERYDQAVGLHQESIAHVIESLGPEHPAALISMDNLGVLYLQMGQFEQAKSLLTKNLETRLQVFGPHHSRTYMTESLLGRALSNLGEHDAGEAMLLHGYQGLCDLLGEDHRYASITRNSLIRHYQRIGNETLAAKYTAMNEH